MAVILQIETSTTVCSAALSQNSSCIMERTELGGLSHATMLPRFLQEIVSFLTKENLKVDAVSVSCGPGSYTGLRIGVSSAKGLCYGWNVPLIAVDTLAVLCEGLIETGMTLGEDDLLCPMIDARRMEVYTAFYNKHLERVVPISAEIVSEDSFSDILASHKVYFFGDGAEKCRNVLTHQNAIFVPNVVPFAKNMTRLSATFFAQEKFQDVAYFEPFYLKDFIATLPKKLI
ncbi:MAG: tRNA (adenosine(37)-N6)-threonylcarbamoyltransferase complex dimerization subunit type 1 TsaB [Paludibacteraceae bacterium]|nr:tRNA (adenosine(37)-N6)-threonylcarbamoyltransferase complex dimerization subunit type 1 TsaB [Paludibacteraceae bacterium]